MATFKFFILHRPTRNLLERSGDGLFILVIKNRLAAAGCCRLTSSPFPSVWTIIVGLERPCRYRHHLLLGEPSTLLIYHLEG